MSTRDDIVSLTEKLKNLRRYVLLCRSTHGMLLTVTLFLAVLIAANILNAAFHLPIWLRVIYLVASAVVILTAAFMYLLRPMIAQPSLEDLSLQVEKKYTHLDNRLIASLQLESNLRENRENYSTAMIRALIKQTSGVVEGLNLKSSYSNNPLKKLAKYSGAALIVALFLAIATPGLFQSSLHVFSHPLDEIEIPTTFEIFVEPGSTEILKYDKLEVTVVLKGERLPESAELFWDNSDNGGDWRSDDLEPVIKHTATENLGNALGMLTDSTTFVYSFKDVKHDFKYFVRAGREESSEYTVTVVDKPTVTGLKLTYDYPDYTRLQRLVIDENDGNVQAIKGTKVEVELTTNKPVESGKLVFSDGSTAELKCDETKATAAFRVDANKSYHAEVIDFSGYTNPYPIEYRVTMLEDAYPEIYMVSPGGNVNLNDDMAVTLMANLSDDFGFSKLLLHYTMHLTMTEQWDQTEKLPVARSKPEQRTEYFWDLANVGLLPGSWIEYYLEVFDNDVISGPKSARGPTLIVRLPSLDELFADIESSREDQLEAYFKSLEQQQEIGEEFRRLAQELRMEKEIDWEMKKDLEGVAGEQTKLFDELESLAEDFEQVNQKALENQLLSLEMMEKMKELQELFEKVATPEMKEAMKKLQEALAKMDKSDIEEALEDFEMSLEDVVKNLERAIAQLKQLQIEQKMKDMIRMAEEILRNQQSVNSLTQESSATELPSAAPKEKGVRSELDALKEEADELEKMLPSANMKEDENAKNFCAATRESGAEPHMDNMIASLNQSQKQDAMESGENSEIKLTEMLNKMVSSQAAMSQQMGAQMAAEMRSVLDDLFYLSDKQEELLGKVGSCRSQSPELRNLAEDQKRLQEHASWLNDRMFELSKESIYMQRTIDKVMNQCMSSMGRSISTLSELNQQRSMDAQKDAMFSLNQAARDIMESLNSQKQCNSSCSNPNPSMMKKMGQMCNGQKKVNQQTQSMCDSPNNMGAGNQGTLKRIAGEQAAIRKSMDELNREFGDKQQISGRLENLSEEMQKVVEALEEGGVGEQTLSRQRKIYQRMLNFQLALERQDFSEQRQAEHAEQILRRGPDQLETGTVLGPESYDRRLQRFLDEGYPPEYESLIKDYFKAIMEVGE